MGLIIYVDGGSRGNPGPSGAGVVIRTEEGQLIHEAGYFLGKQTNNAAEYHALLRALERVQRLTTQAPGSANQSLCVYSDSELLVRQMTGEYEVKSPRLAPLYRQVQLLLLRVPRWSFRHVPREENHRADQLANLAMDRRRNVIVFDVDGGADPAYAELAADGMLAAEAAAAGGEPRTDVQSGTQAGAGPQAHGGISVGGAAVTSAGTPLPDETSHAVRVTLAQAPRGETCPLGVCPVKDFTVTNVVPAALCVYAAHAILPTLLAMLNTDRDEFAAVPTLTVRCSRAGCGAVFRLAPVRSSNGDPRHK